MVHHYGDWYLREKRASRLGELLDNLARFLPWAILLPAAAWWWWRDRDPRRRPLLAWTAVIAVAVSLSGEQRARYFVPVIPPLSLLVGELLVHAPRDRVGRRVLAACFGVTLLVVLALVVILLWLPIGAAARAPSTFMPSAGWERGLACGLALAGLLAVVVLMARGAGFGATAILALALGRHPAHRGMGVPDALRGELEHPRIHRGDGRASGRRRAGARLSRRGPLV